MKSEEMKRSEILDEIKKCGWKPEELKELAEMEIGKPISEMSNEKLEKMLEITRTYCTIEEYFSDVNEYINSLEEEYFLKNKE